MLWPPFYCAAFCVMVRWLPRQPGRLYGVCSGRKVISMSSVEEVEGSEVSLQQVIHLLRGQLAETEEILQAISEHKVDAFVIGAATYEQVYKLKGADHVYQ